MKLKIFIFALTATACATLLYFLPSEAYGQTIAPMNSGYITLTWTISPYGVSDTSCSAEITENPSRDKFISCYLWKKRNNEEWKYAALLPVVGAPNTIATKSVYVYNGIWKFRVVPYDDNGNKGQSCHYFVGAVTPWGGKRFQYPTLNGTMGYLPLRETP